jgi:chromosome segregation ATPase
MEAEVEELKEQLAALPTRAQESTETDTASSEKIRTLQKQLKDGSDRVAALQQVITEQDAKMVKQEKILAQFKTITEKTYGMLSDTEQARRELEQCKEASDKLIRILERENNELARQIVDAQQKLAASEQERAVEREDAEVRIHQLQSDLKTRCDGFKDVLNTKDGQIQQLKSELEIVGKTASATQANLENQITGLQQDLVRAHLSLDDERAKATASLDWAEETVNANADEMDDINGELTTEISALKNTLVQKDKALQEKIAHNDTLTQVMRSSCSRITYLEKENTLFKRDLLDRTQEKTDMSDMITTLRDENAQLANDLFIVRGERDNLVAENHRLQAQVYELDNMFVNVVRQNETRPFTVLERQQHATILGQHALIVEQQAAIMWYSDL